MNCVSVNSATSDTLNFVSIAAGSEFVSKINIIGQIDLATINQSTRPKKKTKEEKKKEMAEFEIINEAILKDIPSYVSQEDQILYAQGLENDPTTAKFEYNRIARDVLNGK